MPVQTRRWNGASWIVVKGGGSVGTVVVRDRETALAARAATTRQPAQLVEGETVGALAGFDHPVWDKTPPGAASYRLPNGGGIVEGVTIYGRILPALDNSQWIFRDFIHKGCPVNPGGNSGCFELFTKYGNSDQPGARPRVVLRDGTIDPDPDYWWPLNDGIVGHGFKAERLVIRHVTDGIGPVAPANGVNCNAEIIEPLIEGLIYHRDDGIASHADGSHNDPIQHQAGGGLIIRRPEIRTTHGGWGVGTANGTPHPNYPLLLSGGDANGVGILIQRNQTGVAVAPPSQIIIDSPRISHGKVGLVIKSGNHATVYNMVAVKGSFTTAMSGATAVSIDSRASSTVVGLCEGGAILNTGNNRWSDGPLLSSGAANGIYSA